MIRKSATGVIVALAVIWGGGTWYTGTQIQPGVEKFIKDFNDAKKKGEHAYDMTLSYQNFDKGFFNSRFQMQMTFDNGAPDLNIKPGQTTFDGRFTLLPTCCLGNCDKGPTMMIDEDTHSYLTPEAIPDLLEQYK